MKAFISALFSLVSVVAALPHAMDEGDPLFEKSRVTAFVVAKDGTPSVECWEITNMINDQQIRRADGSKGGSRVTLAGTSELDGVDILTWPAYSPIWPGPNDARSEWLDLSTLNNLFSVQGGLVNFHFNFRVGSNDDDDEPTEYVFSLENGDDWFYFEDSYTGSSLAQSADAAPSPFTIATISGTETEVLNFRFPSRPKHKVLHKGACSFSGIKVPEPSSQRKSSYTKNPLVQQHGDSDL